MIYPHVKRNSVDPSIDRYDCLIAAAGYETRATHISKQLKGRYRKGYAPGFDKNLCISFSENKQWFEKENFEYIRLNDEEFRGWFKSVVDSLKSMSGDAIRIAIDISCFNRLRLATFVDELRKNEKECNVIVDFYYNIAKYSPPPRVRIPNVHIGPVIEPFAGWSSKPEQSVTAIVGVGYEEDRALGAVEHIQASDVRLYVPRSPIEEYERAVANANSTLFDLIPDDDRILYQVKDPYHTFAMLEGAVYKALLDNGVVMFPFGPKIYAICCLLVATIHNDAAVWRVSPGDLREPRDREPSEHVVSLRAEFDPAKVESMDIGEADPY